MRKPDPERIHLARGATLVSRLIGSGMSAERAEALVSGWETGATAHGLEPHSLAFWDGGLRWGDDPKEHRLPIV